MISRRHFWMPILGLCLWLTTTARSAPLPAPLMDGELEQVYAAGFDVQVVLGLEIKTNDPNAVLIRQDQLDALRDYANSSLHRSTARDGADGSGTFDTDGISLSNFESVINNSMNISGSALQNAQSLLTIFAMGDVAVGLNLTVIVNPGDAPFSVTQTSINWSDLTFSAMKPTLTVPSTQ